MLNFKFSSDLSEFFESVPVKQTKSKRRKPGPVEERRAVAAAPEKATAWTPVPFLERYALAIFLALVAVGSARIVSTYPVFSHTWDEPGHIASGVEWLRKGSYKFDRQHPPLTRIAVGIGPSLMGMEAPVPQPEDMAMFAESRRVLYGSHKYQQILNAARIGILPFFWIACLVVYLWARRYAGGAAAVLAVFLFSFFPAVLGHAGMATTDMACTAMLSAVFLAGCILLEEPSLKRAVVFGACGGLAILSKFSVLAFFPAGAAVALAWYVLVERPGWRAGVDRAKKLAPLIGLAAAVAALLVWAGYRFSVAQGLPAPDMWAGIGRVANHNASGHWSYLLGRISRFGFWDFFPVAIAVKTPIAFLLLAAIGFWLALRNRGGRRLWLAAAFAAGILAVAMSSNINIGLRHILPMYAGLAVLGGAASVELGTRSPRGFLLSAVLVLWMAGTSLLSHPDYLSYFNLLAGSHPESILVDSDLDWGQDVSRLGRRLHELGVHQVTFVPNDKIDLRQQPGFEGITVNEQMSWAMPTEGWNAVELTGLKLRRLGFMDAHPELTFWPNVIPEQERVGNSILLWHFGGSQGEPRALPWPSEAGK
ncbi:MAG TPA: glycosyltransferase family 39 protein [Bryobacteraceae bacterium]|nr:glycosyltransferase family 39 protein [Bryobacteraceae bacterium]